MRQYDLNNTNTNNDDDDDDADDIVAVAPFHRSAHIALYNSIHYSKYIRFTINPSLKA